MDSCKRCDASSWMVSLTENGLCRQCNLIVVNRVQLAAERIYRSLALFAQVDRREEKTVYASRIVEHARILRQYEEMGLETTRPAPSRLLSLFERVRNSLREERESEIGPDESQSAKESEGAGDRSGVDADSIPGPASFRLSSAMDPMGSFEPQIDPELLGADPESTQ